MKDEKKNFDLEQRLINFAILIVKIAESLNGSNASKQFQGNL